MEATQPDVLQLLASDVRKPTALIHFNRLSSILDQRMMTLLIYNAQTTQKDENEMYWIDARTIKEMIGWEASCNYDALYEACRRLKGDLVQWNVLTEDRTIQEEILCSFIITFRLQRHKGRIGYEFHPKLAPVIQSPSVFARIKLLMIFVLAQPRHAYPLYELLADAVSRGLTTYIIAKEHLFLYMGLQDSAYANDWRNFSSKLLKPACAAINAHADISVQFTPLREQRKIASIRFDIARKKSWQPPLLLEPARALERMTGNRHAGNLEAAKQEQAFIASVTPIVTETVARKSIAQHGLSRAIDAREAACAYRDRKGGEVKDFGSVLAKALYEGWQRAPEDRKAGKQATASQERRERIAALQKLIGDIDARARSTRKAQLTEIERTMPEAELSALRAEFVNQLEAGTFPSVYLDSYRRNSWNAPGIKVAFGQFLAGRFLPPEANSLHAIAKEDGRDYAGLRDELARLEGRFNA